jgi:hypothetical protein
MDIHFPGGSPEYRADEPQLSFWARVDGKPVNCAISAEALEDYFGAASMRETDLVTAFVKHRGAIETAAAALLKANRGSAVVLHSGYFRMYGAA